MKVVVVDGQGGRLGRMIVETITKRELQCNLVAIGTNSIATSAMMKSGAAQGATGENPVLVACQDADVIIGPIGMIAANALLGEITPAMAVAIGSCRAVKLLLPVGGVSCDKKVIGVKDISMKEMVEETVDHLAVMLERE